MSKTPKSDQLRALREARFVREQSNSPVIVTPRETIVAIIPPPEVKWSQMQDVTSWSADPSTGSMKVRKRGRPKKTDTGFDKTAYMRGYMKRKRRAKAEAKS